MEVYLACLRSSSVQQSSRGKDKEYLKGWALMAHAYILATQETKIRRIVV
jgi:hypothetical protein